MPPFFRCTTGRRPADCEESANRSGEWLRIKHGGSHMRAESISVWHATVDRLATLSRHLLCPDTLFSYRLFTTFGVSLSSRRICWQFAAPPGCNQNVFRMEISPYISTPNLRQPWKETAKQGKIGKTKLKCRKQMWRQLLCEHISASFEYSFYRISAFRETQSSHYAKKLYQLSAHLDYSQPLFSQARRFHYRIINKQKCD